MAKSKPSDGSGGGKQDGGQGAGWSSTTGNPSGKGRENNPPKSGKK